MCSGLEMGGSFSLCPLPLSCRVSKMSLLLICHMDRDWEQLSPCLRGFSLIGVPCWEQLGAAVCYGGTLNPLVIRIHSLHSASTDAECSWGLNHCSYPWSSTAWSALSLTDITLLLLKTSTCSFPAFYGEMQLLPLLTHHCLHAAAPPAFKPLFRPA